MNNLYKQCLIKYESGALSTVWIPSKFAEKGKDIIVGKHNIDGVSVKVVRVYNGVSLEEEQINLNKKSKFDSIKEMQK